MHFFHVFYLQDKIGEYSEPSDEETIGAWESKELVSRDGETKLKSDVFFATFDQRALVAVISHWLHSNADATPTRPEFDDLIVQGSSEWRNLCDNSSYLNDFPNKHFDLETFASLSGAMSFDEIWQKIVAINDHPRVYIISWNDHFFVLKIDRDAYYIIDTLGERLFEGCEKAFVLRFDDSSLMVRKENGDDEDDEKIICSGKECCREFIVRFLAAIPLEELEEEEKKEAVSYFSLHQRLQIEFNLTCMLSSPFSSLSSSPFSSSAVSTPSRL
nr:EEIG1/EHBP1 N-terminal domain protein [Ipomoea batatas]